MAGLAVQAAPERPLFWQTQKLPQSDQIHYEIIFEGFFNSTHFGYHKDPSKNLLNLQDWL